MKWQPVKNKLHLGLALGLMMVLAGVFCWRMLPTSPLLTDKYQTSIKIGFVDLMSHQNEVYHVDFQVLDDCILTTFKQPENKDFLLKGNLVEVQKANNLYNYKYNPVIASVAAKKTMAYEFVESMTHTDLWFQASKNKRDVLMIGQEGVVLPL
jgi:hypothetical protein